MTKYRFRLGVYILVSLFLMALIFAFSAQDAAASQKLSDGVLYKILSSLNLQQFMERYEIIIRKLAHFSLFFALGLSSSLMFFELGPLGQGKVPPPICAFIFNFLYAASDEIHQYFVPGRSMQFSDVLLDSAGALTAIVCVYTVRKFIFKSGGEWKQDEQTSSAQKK